MKTATATLASLSLLALVPIGPAQAQRVIDSDGVGNCIFAPVKLPFGKEGSAPYQQVTNTFNPGQTVYARCYYRGTLGSFRNKGRLYNSIRNDQSYSMNLFWVAPLADGSISPSQNGRPITRGVSLDAGDAMDWDGQLFTFGPDICEITVPLYDRERLQPYPNKCLNLKNAARFMERQLGLSPQPYAKFCVRVWHLASDTQKWSYRNDSWQKADVQSQRPMARGCFILQMD